MAAGITAEGNGVQSLARETGVSDAIKTFQACSIEWHRQQTWQSACRNWPIGPPHPPEEATMGSGGTHLLKFDGLRQTRKDGLQSLNQTGRVVPLFAL